MIVMEQEAGEHPEAKRVLPTVLRSLQRPDQKGLAEATIKNVQSRPMVLPSGLYVGHAPGYNVDLLRLDRVAERMILGLYFREFGSPLPKGYGAKAYSPSGLAKASAAVVAPYKDTAEKLLTGRSKVVGNGVFQYWHQRTEEDAAVTAWLLAFFSSISFLGITAPVRQNPLDIDHVGSP